MTCTRSLIRVALIAAAAAALLGGFALAAPAVAHASPVIGPGSGRTGGSLAAVVALIAAVIGGLALARSAGRIGTGTGRNGAIVALVAGLIGIVLAGLHLATNTGAICTGSGGGGALVGLLLGVSGHRPRWAGAGRRYRGPRAGADRPRPGWGASCPLPPHRLTGSHPAVSARLGANGFAPKLTSFPEPRGLGGWVLVCCGVFH